MQGAFVRAGEFIRINTVLKPDDATFAENLLYLTLNTFFSTSRLPVRADAVEAG